MFVLLDVYNMAISHLGTGKQITDVDERGQEAAKCRQWGAMARRITLQRYRWPFATRYATLTQVTRKGDAGHPTEEYEYSYRYPTTALFVRRVLNQYNRNPNPNQKIPFKVIQDNTGKLILTDIPEGQIEYVVDVEDLGFAPEFFILAYSYVLAAHIAPGLTKGDQRLPDKMFRFANYYAEMGAAIAANEETPDVMPDSEMIEARGI
jgi:hypothetical protein